MLLLLLATAACGSGASDVPPGEPVSYARDLEHMVVKRCLGCHTSREPEAGLVLERGQGYSRLVDRPSVQAPALALVAPGDLGRSYLWHKVDHTAAVGKGMPRTLLGAKRLPDRELDLYRRWIADGARP